jgi:hypothetical protein
MAMLEAKRDYGDNLESEFGWMGLDIWNDLYMFGSIIEDGHRGQQIVSLKPFCTQENGKR